MKDAANPNQPRHFENTTEMPGTVKGANDGPASHMVPPVPMSGEYILRKFPLHNQELNEIMQEMRELNKVIKESYTPGGGVISDNSTAQTNNMVYNINAVGNPIDGARNLTTSRLKELRGTA